MGTIDTLKDMLADAKWAAKNCVVEKRKLAREDVAALTEAISAMEWVPQIRKSIESLRRDINEPDKLICHIDRLAQLLPPAPGGE